MAKDSGTEVLNLSLMYVNSNVLCKSSVRLTDFVCTPCSMVEDCHQVWFRFSLQKSVRNLAGWDLAGVRASQMSHSCVAPVAPEPGTDHVIEQGRIHGIPVADGWAGAVMRKLIGIQKCYGMDRPTDQPTDRPTNMARYRL